MDNSDNVYYLYACKAKSKDKRKYKEMQNISERKRRSEKMTREEHKAFLKYVNSLPTKFDATQALGISRPTLDAVIFKGSGRPDTIHSIRQVLGQTA